MTSLLLGIGLLLCLPTLWRLILGTRGTTLFVPAIGAAMTWTFWSLLWLVDEPLDLLARGLGDQLWYAVAILGICPSVAVLGARRPIARVWPWFVLIPLILVLIWPALLQWSVSRRGAEIDLEEPALLVYGVVSVMGMGNYIGTRYTLSALLGAAALALLVAPYSIDFPDELLSRSAARQLATAGFSLALVAGGRRKQPDDDFRWYDRLWNDFRNDFGLVWATRCMERINMEARKEQWGVRLEPTGFVWPDREFSTEERQQVETRMEHHLRWLFRRFVDDDWFQQYIPRNPEETA